MAGCSRCDGPLDRWPQRYCKACHAAYMREHRPKHSELSDEQRAKANCRSYANVYRRRGKLKQEPCAYCGDPDTQMHHEDYSKPLEVVWVCRACHRAEHVAAEIAPLVFSNQKP